MVEKEEAVEKDDFKYFVRVASTDLEGNKQIHHALTKIKGVSFMFSNMICTLAGIDKSSKTGNLKDDQIKKLDDVISDPLKFKAPVWILNRRKDYEDGLNKHLSGSDLTFSKENDIKRLKKIKSYKGMRHGVGLPVRGQRTKSNFRRNKGKGSLGVKKKSGAKSGK